MQNKFKVSVFLLPFNRKLILRIYVIIEINVWQILLFTHVIPVQQVLSQAQKQRV